MRRIAIAGAAIFLVASATRLHADLVHITVDEPNDNPPSVTTDIVSPTSRSGFEIATVSGFVLGSSLPVGTTSVLLTEPTADPFNQPNSDLIVLQILQATTDGSTSQQVTLSFASDSFPGSDGIPGFDQLVAAFPNAIKVPETGSLVDITAALGLPVHTADGTALVLQVSASSDLNTPEIPEPASLTLFGIGLAGIVAYRSRKIRSRAR